MKSLRKCMSAASVMVMLFGPGAAVQAASAVGPYYAAPSWDQKLDVATRFIVLTNWNNEAVLDRETGLVWIQKPLLNQRQWADSVATCAQISVGNRWGPRLPTAL